MAETFPHSKGLRNILRAILELLVGAYGQRLVSELNDQPFERAPDNVPVVEDLGGVFDLNYTRIGEFGLELVLERGENGHSTNPIDVFINLGHRILDNIYGQALDYQALIDDNFRYLYTPRAHWAKFTRIAIFLRTIKQYFRSLTRNNGNVMHGGPGYYHDVFHALDMFNVSGLGSSNYNTFMSSIFRNSDLRTMPVYQLNGDVDETYDPYTNSVYAMGDSQPNHLLVPFMFPQSGIKPMTSVTDDESIIGDECHIVTRGSEAILVCP